MFSIRNVMLASNVMIALIIFGLLSLAMINSWNKLQNLETASEAVQIGTALSKATIELSLERSLTQVALNLDDPLSPEIGKMLATQRELSARLFDQVETLLSSATHIPERQKYLDLLVALKTKAKTFREETTPLFNVSLAERPLKRVEQIPTEIKKIVSEFNGLSNQIRRHIAGIDSGIIATDLVVQRAWVIREYGGRERTLFAIATARKDPLLREDIAYMFKNHGMALQAWEALWAARDSGQLEGDVKAGIRTLKQKYFTEYNALRLQLFANSQEATYKTDFNTLFTQSEEALQTAISLLNTAAAANEKNVADRLSSSRLLLIIQLLVTIGVALVICFTVWYTTRKVSSSLVQTTQTMSKIVDGDFNIKVANVERKDEIGEMARALQVFQTNMAETERLREAQIGEHTIKAERQAAVDQ